jgi:hypothetical protein
MMMIGKILKSLRKGIIRQICNLKMMIIGKILNKDHIRKIIT